MRAATVFNFLIESTLMGSVLILLLLLVRRFLRPQLGSRVLCAAWLLVAVRLLVPLSLPNPMMNELRPTLSANVGVRPIADQVRVRVIDASYDIANMLDGPEYLSTEAAQAISEFGARTSYGHTARWILLGYFCVAAAVLGYMIWQNVRFLRRLKKERVGPLDGEAQGMYLRLCRQRRVKPIPAFWTDPLPSACLVGCLRPYVALPLTTSPHALPYVLAHELCHQKAGDPWWGLVRILCCVVHWFNPLVWLAAHLSRIDQETACDERVTASLRDNERIEYANTLAVEAARRHAPHMAVLATGMTMKGREIKRRIRTIVDGRAAVAWLCIAALMVAGVGTLFSFGTAEVLPELPQLQIDALDVSPVEVQTISGEAEAIDYARSLLASAPYLNGPLAIYDSFDMLDWSALHAPETDTWRVVSQPTYYTVTFSGKGRLYSIIDNELERTGDGKYANPSYRTDAAAREPLYSYVRDCAAILMPDLTIGNLYIDADYYDGETRFVTVRSTGSETCYFYLTVEPEVYLVEIYRSAEGYVDGQNELYRVSQQMAEQKRAEAIAAAAQTNGVTFLHWDEIQPGSQLAQAAKDAYNFLTEVYSYTTEDADTFLYALRETDGGTFCLCIDPELPEWPYIHRLDDIFGTALSPYTQAHIRVSEAGLRYFLDVAEENYWLESWQENDRAALVEQAQDDLCGIALSQEAVQKILAGEWSAGEAVKACFTAVYGSPEKWNEALAAWHEITLVRHGCVDI